MIFIWKKFLQDIRVPSVIFHEVLVKKLKERFEYNAETDSFTGITSKHLPVVASFIKFWDENIIEDNNDLEFEIDEISKLFKNRAEKNFSGIDNDNFLIELIKHFYTYVSIDDNKYISNIKCLSWDKRQDVIDSLDLFKTHCSQGSNKDSDTSLYKAYEYYSSECNFDVVVSKKYFEKVSKEHIGELIDIHGIISSIWLTNLN